MSLRAYTWQLLLPPHQQAFVAKINAVARPAPLDPDLTEVRYAELPFYERCRLCRIVDHRHGAPNERFALAGPDEIVLLNKSSEPIYRCNAVSPVRLDVGNAIDYAVFFFDHVAGKHGRFLVVGAADEIAWTANAGSAVVAAAAAIVRPPVHLGRDEAGRHVVAASVVFKDALFDAKVRIADDGTIELTDEKLRIERLPLLPDVPPQDLPSHVESHGQLYLPAAVKCPA